MKAIKQKKLVLDNAILEEEFFEDALIIGIVCPLPSYKFIWHINQAFHFDFIRNHEFEIETKDKFFEVYQFIEHDKLIEHIMYTNRKGTDFLLDDVKNVDFIWMIKGGYLQDRYAIQLADLLKNMNIVNYCVSIDSNQLNSRQHLIL